MNKTVKTQKLAQILKNADILMKILEQERDESLKNLRFEGEEDLLIQYYKKTLTSIYRIRNNSAALLLKSRCDCKISEDEQTLFMYIDDRECEFSVSALKPILQTDFDKVLERSRTDNPAPVLTMALNRNDIPEKESERKTEPEKERVKEEPPKPEPVSPKQETQKPEVTKRQKEESGPGPVSVQKPEIEKEKIVKGKTVVPKPVPKPTPVPAPVPVPELKPEPKPKSEPAPEPEPAPEDDLNGWDFDSDELFWNGDEKEEDSDLFSDDIEKEDFFQEESQGREPDTQNDTRQEDEFLFDDTKPDIEPESEPDADLFGTATEPAPAPDGSDKGLFADDETLFADDADLFGNKDTDVSGDIGLFGDDDALFGDSGPVAGPETETLKEPDDFPDDDIGLFAEPPKTEEPDDDFLWDDSPAIPEVKPKKRPETPQPVEKKPEKAFRTNFMERRDKPSQTPPAASGDPVTKDTDQKFRTDAFRREPEPEPEEAQETQEPVFSTESIDLSPEEIMEKLRQAKTQRDRKKMEAEILKASSTEAGTGTVFDLGTGSVKSGTLDTEREMGRIDNLGKNMIEASVKDRMMDAKIEDGNLKKLSGYRIQTDSDYTRKKTDFLMDFYKIAINLYDDDGTLIKKDLARMILAPLAIPESGSALSTDICGYLECGGKKYVAAVLPGGKQTLAIRTEEYTVLVKGSWDEGSFSTSVLVTGIGGLKAKFQTELEKIRPDRITETGIGHQVIYVDHVTTVHVLPLFPGFNPRSNTGFFAITIKDYSVDKDCEGSYAAEGTGMEIKGERYRYSLRGSWEDEQFIINLTAINSK